MAKSSEKKSPPANADHIGARDRGGPPVGPAGPEESGTPGLAEAPRSEFAGTPLSGSISDWARQIAGQAEREAGDDAGGKLPRKAIEARPPKKIPERSAAPTRTGRGTSMGGAASARERAAAGLNPVAGLDIPLEEAGTLSNSGVTATVAALARLIESGNPLHKNGELWVPHRPARPEKSEGGVAIRMVSDFRPSGDQPTAIRDLVAGIAEEERTQVLLGVTGSGKTFTMAKVIEETQRPALILAPNKTLAAQLYAEFKSSFRRTPSNISSPITTTTSRKPMFPAPTPTSRRNPR